MNMRYFSHVRVSLFWIAPTLHTFRYLTALFQLLGSNGIEGEMIIGKYIIKDLQGDGHGLFHGTISYHSFPNW
jgi:hypothetical protein